MPIKGDTKKNVELYQKKFVCIDKEDLRLWGDFESDFARQFNIDIVKCNGSQSCKNDTEIEEYFKGKYLLILTNQVLFNNANYGQSAVEA